MPRVIDPKKEARRRAHKAARANARYRANPGYRKLKMEKTAARRVAHERLLELDPTETCVGIAEIPDHVCVAGPKECHHRDGNWRNGADENLAWACRLAHEHLDRLLGV